MFFPEKMNRVTVVVLKRDMEAVLEEIATAGVVHLAQLEELDDWAKPLQAADAGQLIAEFTRRKEKLRRFIEETSGEPIEDSTGPASAVDRFNLAEIDQSITEIEAALAPLVNQRGSLNERLQEVKGIQAQMGTIFPADLPLRRLVGSSYLNPVLGTIKEDQLARLGELLGKTPTLLLPYGQDRNIVSLLCVGLKRDSVGLERTLKEVGFREVPMPQGLVHVPAEVGASIQTSIAVIEKDIEKTAADLALKAEALAPQMFRTARTIDSALLLLTIRHYCKLTDATCLLAGWVPQDRSASLTEAVSKRTQGRAVVEMTPAENIDGVQEGTVEVPVLLRLPWLLQPFQRLIDSYGTSSYRMVNPTLFVAVTFLLMFGMMFGDVGHGLVLVLLGPLVMKKFKSFSDVGLLMVYCGVSSMVFGVLFGSVFGVETLLPALWLRPLEGISTLFSVTVTFGILMLSLGLVLNVVNSLRAHTFWETLFEESGPLVGIAYWAAIGLFLKREVASASPAVGSALAGLVVLSLTVFFFKGPILKLMHRREKACPEGIATYILEGLVEIMEILMGYLANTVSFIRVAAFGLAHAGLFVAVFTLADMMAKTHTGQILSFLIIVAGNVMIIILEGLVVTIQVLRLEYYEFFGKFFKANGLKYAPVSLQAGARDRAN